MTVDYEETRDRRTGLVCWRSSGAGLVQILPDVNADLMFWRGSLNVAGYDTVAHDFDRGPGETTYGIRLPAGALPLLLQDSAATATDARVPISLQSRDSRLARLLDELPTTDNPDRILTGIAAHLLTRAVPDPDIGRAAQAILTLADQTCPVGAIADALGWTQRRLHRFSMDTFGTSVSLLRSLCRFRTAYALLSAGTRPAEAALLAGYSDQAHLNRHIRRFAATTPRQVIDSQPGSTPTAAS